MQPDRCFSGVRVCVHVCICECKYARELLTPPKRDSAVCGWVQETVYAVYVVCTLAVVMQLREHKEVVLFTLVLDCSEQTLTHEQTYLFVHTNTFNKHSLTHIQCTADFLPCSDTADREQCCRRSPGAQEGHRQVWLETDPSLRTACSNSGPTQLFVLDADAWCTFSSIKI